MLKIGEAVVLFFLMILGMSSLLLGCTGGVLTLFYVGLRWPANPTYDSGSFMWLCCQVTLSLTRPTVLIESVVCRSG